MAALADKQSAGLFGSLRATIARTNCFRNFLPTSSPVPLTKQKEQTDWSALFVGAGEERKTVKNCFARTNSTKQGATRLECIERLVATMRLEWESSFKTAGNVAR